MERNVRCGLEKKNALREMSAYSRLPTAHICPCCLAKISILSSPYLSISVALPLCLFPLFLHLWGRTKSRRTLKYQNRRSRETGSSPSGEPKSGIWIWYEASVLDGSRLVCGVWMVCLFGLGMASCVLTRAARGSAPSNSSLLPLRSCVMGI